MRKLDVVQGTILIGSLVAMGLIINGHTQIGCLVGLVTQPFWLYATYTAKQWGMFILSIAYASLYAVGLI